MILWLGSFTMWQHDKDMHKEVNTDDMRPRLITYILMVFHADVRMDNCPEGH